MIYTPLLSLQKKKTCLGSFWCPFPSSSRQHIGRGPPGLLGWTRISVWIYIVGTFESSRASNVVFRNAISPIVSRVCVMIDSHFLSFFFVACLSFLFAGASSSVGGELCISRLNHQRFGFDSSCHFLNRRAVLCYTDSISESSISWSHAQSLRSALPFPALRAGIHQEQLTNRWQSSICIYPI